jgi:hypothetical protein
MLQPIQQTAITFDNIIVPKAQYDQLLLQREILLREKAEHEDKIREANLQILKHTATAQQKDLEIAELKRINEDLTRKVVALETKIGHLEGTISRVSAENLRILSENQQIRDSNDIRQMDMFMAEREFSKYLVVLQDIDRSDELGKHIPAIGKFLRKLRCQRVEQCHLIFEADDSPECIQYKKFLAHKHLQTMSPDCRKMFEKQFKGVVDAVVAYLAPISEPSTMLADERSEADSWFDHT